jgi:hypothetical protein
MSIYKNFNNLKREPFEEKIFSKEEKQYVREAILDDGTIVGYDICTQHEAVSPNFTFVGHGKIYRINGVLQIDTNTKYNFYKRT